MVVAKATCELSGRRFMGPIARVGGPAPLLRRRRSEVGELAADLGERDPAFEVFSGRLSRSGGAPREAQVFLRVGASAAALVTGDRVRVARAIRADRGHPNSLA